MKHISAFLLCVGMILTNSSRADDNPDLGRYRQSVLVCTLDYERRTGTCKLHVDNRSSLPTWEDCRRNAQYKLETARRYSVEVTGMSIPMYIWCDEVTE